MLTYALRIVIFWGGIEYVEPLTSYKILVRCDDVLVDVYGLSAEPIRQVGEKLRLILG